VELTAGTAGTAGAGTTMGAPAGTAAGTGAGTVTGAPGGVAEGGGAASGWRPGTRVPGVRRIAVLRANGVGDLVFAYPALTALRAAYPDAELTLLGSAWHRDFLAGRPGPVDRVEVVPPSEGVRIDAPRAPAAEVAAFFAAQRARGYDLAVQLHGGGRFSNPFVARLGARVAVGLRDVDAPALDATVPYRYYQYEPVRFLEVVGLAGAAPTTLAPRLDLRPADVAEADGVLARVAPGGPLVAVHAGATDGRRRWSPERFAVVADALAAAGARVLLVGAADDAPLTAAVAAAMRGSAQDLAGTVSLGGLAALLARCRVVVGNDSGPLHLAEAVGAATVGIYWCGNVINAAPLTRTRHRIHESWRLACPDCGADTVREGCTHSPSFVDDVAPEPVAASALDLLEAA